MPEKLELPKNTKAEGSSDFPEAKFKEFDHSPEKVVMQNPDGLNSESSGIEVKNEADNCLDRLSKKNSKSY